MFCCFDCGCGCGIIVLFFKYRYQHKGFQDSSDNAVFLTWVEKEKTLTLSSVFLGSFSLSPLPPFPLSFLPFHLTTPSLLPLPFFPSFSPTNRQRTYKGAVPSCVWCLSSKIDFVYVQYSLFVFFFFFSPSSVPPSHSSLPFSFF